MRSLSGTMTRSKSVGLLQLGSRLQLGACCTLTRHPVAPGRSFRTALDRPIGSARRCMRTAGGFGQRVGGCLRLRARTVLCRTSAHAASLDDSCGAPGVARLAVRLLMDLVSGFAGMAAARLTGRVAGGSTGPGCSFLDCGDGVVLVRGLAAGR
jgi:hypothetical protein